MGHICTHPPAHFRELAPVLSVALAGFVLLSTPAGASASNSSIGPEPAFGAGPQLAQRLAGAAPSSVQQPATAPVVQEMETTIRSSSGAAARPAAAPDAQPVAAPQPIAAASHPVAALTAPPHPDPQIAAIRTSRVTTAVEGAGNVTQPPRRPQAAKPLKPPTATTRPTTVVAPAPSGGISAAPPADTGLSAADALVRQLERGLGSSLSPLPGLTDQLNALTPLASALQIVISRLQSLQGADLASATLAASGQPLVDASQAAGLLTSQERLSASPGARPIAMMSIANTGGTTKVLGALFESSSGGRYLADRTDRLERAGIPGRAPVKAGHHSPRPSSADATVTPDTVAGPQPPSASLASGAPASAASGGVGVGGAALAVFAAAAVLLLPALLHGRLTLDLFPWQSALFASRLERPG